MDLYERLKALSVENPSDPIGLRMACSVAADEIERLRSKLKEVGDHCPRSERPDAYATQCFSDIRDIVAEALNQTK